MSYSRGNLHSGNSSDTSSTFGHHSKSCTTGPRVFYATLATLWMLITAMFLYFVCDPDETFLEMVTGWAKAGDEEDCAADSTSHYCTVKFWTKFGVGILVSLLYLLLLFGSHYVRYRYANPRSIHPEPMRDPEMGLRGGDIKKAAVVHHGNGYHAAHDEMTHTETPRGAFGHKDREKLVKENGALQVQLDEQIAEVHRLEKVVNQNDQEKKRMIKLREEHDELNHDYRVIQDELEDLKRERQIEQDEMITIRTDLEKAREQIQDIHAEKDEITAERDGLITEKKELAESVQHQQRLIDNLSDEKSEIESKCQRHEQMVETLKAENAEKERMHQKVQMEVSNAVNVQNARNEEMEEMKGQNEELRAEIESMRLESDKMKEQIGTMDTMQSEKEEIQQRYESIMAEHDKMEKELQTANNELQQNRQQIQVKEEEIATLQQQQRDTTDSMDKVQRNMDQQIATIKEENERLKEEKQSVATERATLMVQVTTMKNDAERDREEKELELKSLREQMESARSEQQETEQQYESIMAEKQSMEQNMKQQLTEKDQEIGVLKEEKEGVINDNATLTQKMEKMEGELQRSREQIEEKEQEIVRLQEEQRGFKEKEERWRAASISTTLLKTHEPQESMSMSMAGPFEVNPKEIETLKEELKVAKSQTVDLKGQLQRMAVGQGIETSFIKEEEFANDKMSKLRQQTLKNLHDDIVEELSDKYEDLEDDEDTDSSDDSKENGDGEKETKSKFELLMDRVASEFLFGVLMESMKAMKERKSKICQMIARQLHVEDNDDQTAEQMVATMIHPQLQQQWEFYFKSKMENQHQIDLPDIDTVVDGVYNVVIDKEPYSSWTFLNENKLKKYIKECAEICWIMILMKPELSFHPTSFRSVHRYNEMDKHDLWEGSKTKNGAQTVYFAVPAISQKHLVDKEKALQVLPGQLFAHNDQSVIDYVMSDPDELLKSN